MPSRATTRSDIEAELGDLLFQVVFHAQMGEERGWFDFASVADAISDKLTARHPHVFARREDRVGRRAEPRLGRTQGARTRGARPMQAASELADVPLALPALARAAKLGKRAGRVGFDWPDAGGVREKIEEELREKWRRRRRAAAAGGDRATCCSRWRTGRDTWAWIRRRRCGWPMPSSNGAFAPWKRWPASARSSLPSSTRRPGMPCGTRSRRLEKPREFNVQ